MESYDPSTPQCVLTARRSHENCRWPATSSRAQGAPPDTGQGQREPARLPHSRSKGDEASAAHNGLSGLGRAGDRVDPMPRLGRYAHVERPAG